ncbi:MAG TPA: hypothetical protein VKF62_10395, partial [Planctomycetota bacterium]|nr:hypothetical protein [Planctomycetota bacterium]
MLASLSGCAVGTYLRDRALDITDVVDPQVGIGAGLGAKVEVSDYVATGLGWGGGYGLEFYGRRATKFGGMFAQVPLYGFNELPFDAGGPIEDDFLLVQQKYMRAPAISRARIGVSVLPFLGYVGLYLNLGEAL